MKKGLKYGGIALGVIVVLALIGGFTINYRGIPSYEVNIPDYQLNSTPESIARGKKLTLTLCAGCHRDPETGQLTGAQMKDAPAEFGTIYSQNITQDKEYGIGDWTPGELMYLLRTGIKKDGQYAPPYMAKLPLMADEDIHAIISFLKSDDPIVAAINKPDQPSEVGFLTKLLCNIAWKPFPLPENRIEMPDTTNKVELGKYLAHNLDCYSCHSADFKTNDFLEPTQSAGYFGGGNPTLNLEGEVVPTANLTPHPTGIGDWTEAEFILAVKSGIKQGEPKLRYPMAPYALLTDYEVGAIFAYLQTIPPVENEVERVFEEKEAKMD
ncbi:cytochrome c [Flavilitoribacter nigricans DSM 23189 = NBRC 102662]|uniref:Cytochrome c n=1 Tax=Flavilitoribacter nigricans (strain ATCC 23147 / DSM 23189 / NBRC 102662 / NCIMB 1420 / SS-2) TaxID=1122177 RepID=A0A2D0MZV7_FLAN2|nr:cytochrome c [Flavilitoribacter nigricans DSM 23189 = NBRC 102662]